MTPSGGGVAFVNLRQSLLLSRFLAWLSKALSSLMNEAPALALPPEIYFYFFLIK